MGIMGRMGRTGVAAALLVAARQEEGHKGQYGHQACSKGYLPVAFVHTHLLRYTLNFYNTPS